MIGTVMEPNNLLISFYLERYLYIEIGTTADYRRVFGLNSSF